MVSSGRRSEKQKEEQEESVNREAFLTLHNDSVNTFDDVISALCDICLHDSLQAEQCAMITHYKGKCEVMKGAVTDLIGVREQLIHRNLTVTID